MSQNGGFIADDSEWWAYGRCPRVVGLLPMSQSGRFITDVPEWWVNNRSPRVVG